MKRTLILLLILLLPVYSEAAYKIILKNGASIDQVRTYSESGNEINLYFDTGSMSILKRDVLRIEGTETPSPEEDQQEEQPAQEPQPQQGMQPEQGTQPEKGRPLQEETQPVQDQQDVKEDSSKPADDGRRMKFNQLNNELNAVNNELRNVQERESSLVKEINEKSGKKFYNTIQLKQLEKEVEPLKQELADVQQTKDQLFRKKLTIENEIRTLQ